MPLFRNNNAAYRMGPRLKRRADGGIRGCGGVYGGEGGEGELSGTCREIPNR